MVNLIAVKRKANKFNKNVIRLGLAKSINDDKTVEIAQEETKESLEELLNELGYPVVVELR